MTYEALESVLLNTQSETDVDVIRRYKEIDSNNVIDDTPLSFIDDTLNRLRQSRHIFLMDFKSGYWQIEVDECDREKTAFVTPDGLYEFKVMPFGLCAAPGTFQRVIDTVLTGLKWQRCLVYLDDVVVFASNFDYHLRQLRTVFQFIKTAGLTLKPTK